MKSSRPTKLIDVGIDWLTLTTKDESRAAEWREAFRYAATMEQAGGHKWVKARRMMYQGESCSGVFFGKSNQGYMSVLSSECAKVYGHLFSPDGVHCTRIDVQATCDLVTRDEHFIENAYNKVVLHKTTNGRQSKYTLVKDTEGGGCLYVGSRSSMLYGRVYDKGVESGTAEPGKRLRWELEIKGDYADQAVAMLWSGADETDVCLSLLQDYFTVRQVECPFHEGDGARPFVSPPVSPDDISSMKWLRGPVATVVERMVRTVGTTPVFSALFSKAQGQIDEEELTAVIESFRQDYAKVL